MEGKKFITGLIPGALGIDDDVHSPLYQVAGPVDHLQSLFEIITVQEDTVQESHPQTKHRHISDLLFGYESREPACEGVSDDYIKITPVVAYKQHALTALGDILSALYREFDTREKSHNTEGMADYKKRSPLLYARRKETYDPEYQYDRYAENEENNDEE